MIASLNDTSSRRQKISRIVIMNCDSERTIHTIGHSTRAIEDFISLLKAHSIDLLVDVRRWPASRHCPQFNREALAAALSSEAIQYLWRGDLGGFRKPVADSPNTGWRVATFRAYADFMLTPKFEEIMNEMERIAKRSSIALMCAEAVPWRCHRQLLADAFVVRGWPVRHIMGNGCQLHALPEFAQQTGKQIIYRTSNQEELL
jgi:uncharacterized protein (DUF488 family)